MQKKIYIFSVLSGTDTNFLLGFFFFKPGMAISFARFFAFVRLRHSPGGVFSTCEHGDVICSARCPRGHAADGVAVNTADVGRV